MAPPNRKHQEIVHFFDRTIGNDIREKRGRMQGIPGTFAVFLNADDRIKGQSGTFDTQVEI